MLLVAPNLTHTETVVRDRFVIGCVTGMRFSDYSRFNNDHINGDLIEILTQKRQRYVAIPTHVEIKNILARWGGALPCGASLRYYNMLLPKIAAKFGLHEKVLVENKIKTGESGGVPVYKVEMNLVLEHSLISTHTARRSFATNAYNAGIPVRKIMPITGHKTEASFFMYVGVDIIENARGLTTHSFFC